MEFRPDLSFEYDYIRIVYEVILSNLRTNKKVVEKDITTIVTRVQNLKKKQSTIDETITAINNLLIKLDDLEKKYEDIKKDEEVLYSCLQDRIKQLQMIDENHYSYENLRIFCEKKLNNLLLDFFLRERFLETANNYIEDEKINSSVEYSIFHEIQKILNCIKTKDVNEALNWCNTNKSKLSKLNSDIRFKLLKQQFLEIYKTGNVVDAVKFARENFSGLNNHKEIQEVMVLLAIKKEHSTKLPKIKHLLSEDRWLDLENDFKQIFFQVYCMKSNSALEVLFQSGLMSLKTPFCKSEKNKNMVCPTCNVEIQKLATSLPSSHHPVTALICRVTGERMDETNPPMALPNGQVYSERAILEALNKSQRFVCPASQKEITKIEDAKKVFIC